MAVTSDDFQEFIKHSIKNGDQFGFGMGASPINSGVSHGYQGTTPDPVTVKNTGHSTKAGFTSHTANFTAQSPYNHVDSFTVSEACTEPWNAHATSHSSPSGNLNHLMGHMTLPTTYPQSKVDKIIENIEALDIGDPIPHKNIWGSPTKPSKPRYFEQFSSKKIAY